MTNEERQYARVARDAYDLIIEHKMSFTSAWDTSAERNIDKIDGRKKLCPKHAFLGLCESGDLKGISMTTQNGSINYQYAKFAINEWKLNPTLSISEVWRKVYLHFKRAKNHQGQLHVLKGLLPYLK